LYLCKIGKKNHCYTIRIKIVRYNENVMENKKNKKNFIITQYEKKKCVIVVEIK